MGSVRCERPATAVQTPTGTEQEQVRTWEAGVTASLRSSTRSAGSAPSARSMPGVGSRWYPSSLSSTRCPSGASSPAHVTTAPGP